MGTDAGLLAEAGARETAVLLVELAGVFWIGAELVILFFVTEARRHVLRNPLPAGPVWDRASTRRAFVFVAFLGATAVAVVVRSVLWGGLTSHAGVGTLPIEQAARVDATAMRAHLILWAGFVTLWVLLETAIVVQGALACRGLFQILPDGAGDGRGKRRGGAVATMLVLFGAVALAGLLSMPVMAAVAGSGAPTAVGTRWAEIRALSEQWLMPYRNAVLLYLRLAGVAWIVVEWVAAVLLWRAFGRLRGVVALRSARP